MLPVPRNFEALRIGSHDDRAERSGHGVSALRAEQTSAIVLALRADEELGVIGKVEVDGAFEFDGADQIFMTTADEELGLAGVGGRLVDGALEGGTVQRFTVAGGAVLQHVEDFDLLDGFARGQVADGPDSVTRTHGAERGMPLRAKAAPDFRTLRRDEYDAALSID